MNIKISKLTDGVLSELREKIKYNLIYKIDPHMHADSYVGSHDDTYAEPEFSGKYIDIMSKLSCEDKKALQNAKIVVDSVINNMRSDGYIGGLRVGMEFTNFSVWNQMFTIMGLLSYYRAAKDEKALSAAEKCTSYIMDYFIRGNIDILDAPNWGTQHISILFSLCDIYSLTKEEKYKKYILHITDALKHSDLNFFDFDSILDLRSKKGIENFVILLALIKYSDLFADTAALKSVQKYWQQICDTQIRNTGNGTIHEVWSEGGNAPALLGADEKPNENCVAVGWIELSLALFFKNPESKYLDAIDKTLYNHILASASEDGSDFAYYQPNFGKKVHNTSEDMYKCCRYRGFTLFSYMDEMLVYESESSVIPVIYTSCEYESDAVKILEATNYPFENNIKFTVDTKNGCNKALKLRLPKGRTVKKLFINGKEVDFAVENGYFSLHLSPISHYEIDLDLQEVITVEEGTIDGKEYAAVSYGAALLALRNDYEDMTIDTSNLNFEKQIPIEENLKFTCKGYSNGKEVTLTFIDYASAKDYFVWVAKK